jgi:hypothetical protein
VGAGATGTRGAPEATLSQEVGTGAMGTHGAPGATLSQEVGARATGTRGALGAAMHREVGARAQMTRGGPGATLSREAGTTPPPPLSVPLRWWSGHGDACHAPRESTSDDHTRQVWLQGGA